MGEKSCEKETEKRIRCPMCGYEATLTQTPWPMEVVKPRPEVKKPPMMEDAFSEQEPPEADEQ